MKRYFALRNPLIIADDVVKSQHHLPWVQGHPLAKGRHAFEISNRVLFSKTNAGVIRELEFAWQR
ncbi:MAG: hypothetical protein P8J33_05925 [Pirellulaceae bacterium]|nr:hypothetical protein [Pirellulaceae bacterium]